MTRTDIQKEIEFYNRRLIEDPEGEDLYKTMIKSLKKELKKYGK